MLDIATTFRWSVWWRLSESWQPGHAPAVAGLYRIRRVGRDDLDYVGQTGAGQMTLRLRLAMLRGVYGSEMPYRDPHTAGPGLWALRQTLGTEFEASVLPVEGPTAWRKGLEALAITLYRLERGASPTVNFGRMPPGYQPSSPNNARLVARGLRHRGGPTDVAHASHAPGIAPIGPLQGAVTDGDWGGHLWSGWTSMAEALRDVPATAQGLYRIRGEAPGRLVYIGQGLIRSRLGMHAQRATRAVDVQGGIFAVAGPLEVSWVANPQWSAVQRLEIENDLIAAHVWELAMVPVAQFLG